MVAPSKLYQPPLCHLHCSQMIHPGATCFEFLLRNLCTNVLPSSKYFLPLLISPLLVRSKDKERKKWNDVLKYYLIALCSCSFISAFSIFCICVLRHINGRFTKYSCFFLPACSILLSTLFLPQRTIRLYLIATMQGSLETLLRLCSNPVSRLILDSKLIQTFLFMINSAIILHYKRHKQYTGFWFIQPDALPTDDTTAEASVIGESESKCRHDGVNCRQYILKGLTTYLPYGLGLDLLKVLLKQKAPSVIRGFWRHGLYKLGQMQFSMTSFFLAYVGIYRISNCLLSKHLSSRSATERHLLSSFLGGAAFFRVNKIAFCTLSSVLAVQILWQRFCNQSNKSNNVVAQRVLKTLKEFPFARVIIPFATAFLVHCFFFHSHTVNSLIRGIFDNVTNFMPGSVLQYLMSHNVEFIMEEKSRYALRGFFR